MIMAFSAMVFLVILYRLSYDLRLHRQNILTLLFSATSALFHGKILSYTVIISLTEIGCYAE